MAEEPTPAATIDFWGEWLSRTLATGLCTGLRDPSLSALFDHDLQGTMTAEILLSAELHAAGLPTLAGHVALLSSDPVQQRASCAAVV